MHRALINDNFVHVHVVPEGYLLREVDGQDTWVPPTEYWSRYDEYDDTPDSPWVKLRHAFVCFVIGILAVGFLCAIAYGLYWVLWTIVQVAGPKR